MKRLLNPFGNTPWPQATNLAIRRPVERVARGQNFEIEVIDARGARLPPEVRIHYRLPTPEGGTIEETESMRIAGGVAAAKRDGVLRPFSFRIEGGDDQSSIPWTDVDVVEPPAVESLSIRLTPPAYTGEPAAPSERFIRATIGTSVQFTGKATKPLASAALCFEDGRKIPAKVNEDGDTFTAASSVAKSGAYWFALTDREGLHGGGDDRWEIARSPTPRPAYRSSSPAPICLSLRRPWRRFAYRRKTTWPFATSRSCSTAPESEPETALRLFSGPARPPRQPEANPAGDSRVVDYRWNLAPLNLQAGAK